MNNITLNPIYQIPLDNGKEEITLNLVHTWYLDEYDVNLLSEGDDLYFQVLDLNKKLINEGKVPPINIDENNSLPMEMWIWFLKQCEPILSDNFIPEFCPLKVQWSFGNINVKLLKLNDNKLMWRYSNPDLNRIMDISSEKILLIPSKDCHPDTALIVEKIVKGEENPNLLQDFKVVSLGNLEHLLFQMNSQGKAIQVEWKLLRIIALIELVEKATIFVIFLDYMKKQPLNAFNAIEGLSSNGTIQRCFSKIEKIFRLFSENVFQKENFSKSIIYKKKFTSDFQCDDKKYIEIKPISTKSKIDPRVRVSKFTWGVTLIANGGSTGDHALLIIEGINNGYIKEFESKEKINGKYVFKYIEAKVGEYFVYEAHLKSQDDVSCHAIDPNRKIQFERRSKIWMRECKKVQEMLSAMEKRAKDPIRFSFTGKDSFFLVESVDSVKISTKDSAHNCFTFLREYLKMIDVDLGKSNFGSIATIVRSYIKKPEYYSNINPEIQI